VASSRAVAVETVLLGLGSEPEAHAALGDQPQTPPSQTADPVLDAHMVADMWLVSHE
jgi:hypothetical protein